MSLRVYVDEKIVDSFTVCKKGDIYKVLEHVGFLNVNDEGSYFEVGNDLIETLQINPQLIPFIIGFSFKSSIFLPDDRRQGVYTISGASLALRRLFNSPYNFLISCQITGGIEVYKKLYYLYLDVCTGRRWPDPDGDFTAVQCPKPIMQVRYHLREALWIVRNRIVAHFRRVFRR